MDAKTTITGFPRIGERRELKKALENFWAKTISVQDLRNTASALRKKHWLLQKEAGIDLISCNDFSFYDGMLDTIMMLNAIPERFRGIKNREECYFSMARGCNKSQAMEMTKWFNTNYHYIVPELEESMEFLPDISKITEEYREAKALGINPKINVIGPMTFLGLAKIKDTKNSRHYFKKIIDAYAGILKTLSLLDQTVYIQSEEPILVREPSEIQLELLQEAYMRLGNTAENIRIAVTTYFEHSCEATTVLAKTPVWGIGLDFVNGIKNLESLDITGEKKLIAGVVDGRNIWINNMEKTLKLLESISEVVKKENMIISTSCSLLHVPFSACNEPDSSIKHYLSFAAEKVRETAFLGKLFHGPGDLSPEDNEFMERNRSAVADKKRLTTFAANTADRKIQAPQETIRKGNSTERAVAQSEALKLPPLPTTTIGSFPQTHELRNLRKKYKNGTIPSIQYEREIKNHIDQCIAFQEETGLDVLVHGEFERNDMVEYFAEMLEGFHFTANGWVQSYGSRCVKPPVIFGNVTRPGPMTVKWISYAQSRTRKPVKGMLTGPVTILNWSFVRDDMPRSEVATQIALSLAQEIKNLQEAGIRIIQVDEAAFREGYPLRKENIRDYEDWAVRSFHLAVSTAQRETQIHTQMCYSDFRDIIKTIEAMDADVITIETARSGNKLLNIFKTAGYRNQIGPGVYDIHSPRIPSVEEFKEQINSRLEVLPSEKLWVNPDCGLKTRKWEEVKPALCNMAEAARQIRMKYSHIK